MVRKRVVVLLNKRSQRAAVQSGHGHAERVASEQGSGTVSETGCLFCQIVAGRLPARIVREDANTVAFLDINPAADGHTLVVPRVHVRTLADADPGTAGTVFAAASEVARLLRVKLAAEGLTVVQSNERAGWQDVFHLHVHLIPRHMGDALTRPWEPRPGDGRQLDATLARLLG
jgi:histidine triad (HIT) family protein